jgi:glutamine synthetase
MPQTLEATLARLKSADIKRVRLGHFDLKGTLRGVTVSLDAWRHLALHGALPLFDVGGGQEARARVDLDSLRFPPWTPSTAAFLMDVVQQDGSAHPACPRGLLQRVVTRARDAGHTAMVGTTLSFTVFRENQQQARAKGFRNLTPLHGGGTRGAWLATSEANAFVGALWDALQAFDVTVDELRSGEGPGVIVASLRPAGVLIAADQAALFKVAVMEVALQHGMCATFMARPAEGAPRGIGAFTLSMWNQATTENLFVADGGRPTSLAESCYAGLTEHGGAALTFLLPCANSYAWTAAELEETALTLEMPGHGAAISGWHGVRLCVGASDVNPYTAMAAILALGMHGQDKKSEIPHAANRDRPVTRRVLDVPSTWDDALGRLRMSSLARSLLGNATVEAYLQQARESVEMSRRAVSDVDLMHLFETV